MATTVTSAMAAFLAAIQPTSNQTSEASTSHSALRAYLRDQLTVSADFLTGSYRRGTMLRQSRDIDLFLVLDSSYYNGTATTTGYKDQATGPANLLDRIKRLLQAKYPNTAIGRDGQAVRVEFSHVHIDVVPAFYAALGGYLIPDSPSNSWIRSDPTKHREAISTTNAKRTVDGRLVPLAKMIKYWNHDRGYGMKGFFLEMWARDIFQYWSLPSYAEGLHTFFDRGVVYIDSRYAVNDPATSVNLMQSYLASDARRSDTRARLVVARDLAAKAINANAGGENKTAVETWKRLFGAAFPSYG
ncbi:MAG: nucleotidyltransferase domain-containing protein [Chloroflexota bacterium]|nr:nucleotidyltransferase domain-containing protein [Chloroflexota bacterium]